MQLLNKVLAFGAVSILLTGCPEKKDPDKDVSAEDSKAAGYTAPDIKSEESGAKKPVDVTPPSETAAGKAPVTAPAKQTATPTPVTAPAPAPLTQGPEPESKFETPAPAPVVKKKKNIKKKKVVKKKAETPVSQ